MSSANSAAFTQFPHLQKQSRTLMSLESDTNLSSQSSEKIATASTDLQVCQVSSVQCSEVSGLELALISYRVVMVSCMYCCQYIPLRTPSSRDGENCRRVTKKSYKHLILIHLPLSPSMSLLVCSV